MESSHSSLGLAFRAVVMLACLAAVPLLGTYGKRLPVLYQAVVDAYKARMQANGTDRNRPDSRLETTPFARPPFAGGGTSDGMGWPPRTLPDGIQTNPGVASATGGTKQAVFNDADARADSSVRPAAPNAGTGWPGSPTVRSEWADPAAGTGANSHPADPAANGSPDSCTVQFRRIERRLRELGATYYLLETWGQEGDRYRFLCHMAIAGNTESGRNRIFQDTGSDPLQAMQSVLQQVEDWRARRQP